MNNENNMDYELFQSQNYKTTTILFKEPEMVFVTQNDDDTETKKKTTLTYRTFEVLKWNYLCCCCCCCWPPFLRARSTMLFGHFFDCAPLRASIKNNEKYLTFYKLTTFCYCSLNLFLSFSIVLNLFVCSFVRFMLTKQECKFSSSYERNS